MKIKTTSSSIIDSVSYLAGSKLLSVNLNGRTYLYDNVPSQVAQDFANASSPGRYFAQNIRGKYDYITA